jgi:beta-N-acetylhexosaminidase
MRRSYQYCLFVCFLLASHHLSAQNNNPLSLDNRGNVWVDSIFNSLTPDERLGQLFMLATFSNRGQAHTDTINNLICNYNIGGLIFFQGSPMKQAILTNEYQCMSKVPLLIGIDGEWGLQMRLDSTIRFPRQMTLGAMHDESGIYQMGKEIARQCKRIGIHINFAPVIDINSNPLNPIISSRSFGENKIKVAQNGLAYMRGLQENGVMACGKHFPGHGDADADSHKALPTISKSFEALDSLELFPFKKLIAQGLQSIMVAHLNIPSLDSTKNMPSTLSKNIVDGLLKTKLGFKGLIFTDALNMKGVSAYCDPGKLDVKALIAGNDVLLYSCDVARAVAEINLAIQNCEITQEEIDEKVKKILSAKYLCGLKQFQLISTNHLNEDLNNPQAKLLMEKLFEKSITLLQNKDSIIPLMHLDELRIASLSLGDTLENIFQRSLGNYAPIDLFNMSKYASKIAIDTMINRLSAYSTVIISVHNTSINASKNYGITPGISEIVKGIKKNTHVILVMFGNPYALSKIQGAENTDALLMAYEGAEMSMSLTAQIIFGAIPAKGKLPVNIGNLYKQNEGLSSMGGLRLKYTLPEELNIASEDLNSIDSIVGRAIAAGAIPGCQVLAAKDGKVFYMKSFGHHTDEHSAFVKNTDIYDLASITKIASTGLAMMHLYDHNKLNVDKRIYKFLPEFKVADKREITVREMLTHQAGFEAFMPIWMNTLDEKGDLSTRLYQNTFSTKFPVQVADSIYLRKDYQDTIWKQIVESPIKIRGKYLYSDLGLIISKNIVEKICKKPIDQYVNETYYRSLGLPTLGFKPRNRFKLDRIVPSNRDKKFRKRIIHGDVHDPTAAMLGGVSGNAGLFSEANDLAILMQMLLQDGNYGGIKYLSKETIGDFIRQQYPGTENRRGLAFDKPEPDKSKNGPTAKSASPETFGHTGFTGTCVWADPQNQLIYVFLSNRTYPDAEENKLAKMNTRTDIHEILYQAIDKAKKNK